MKPERWIKYATRFEPNEMHCPKYNRKQVFLQTANQLTTPPHATDATLKQMANQGTAAALCGKRTTRGLIMAKSLRRTTLQMKMKKQGWLTTCWEATTIKPAWLSTRVFSRKVPFIFVFHQGPLAPRPTTGIFSFDLTTPFFPAQKIPEEGVGACDNRWLYLDLAINGRIELGKVSIFSNPLAYKRRIISDRFSETNRLRSTVLPHIPAKPNDFLNSPFIFADEPNARILAVRDITLNFRHLLTRINFLEKPSSWHPLKMLC